MDLERSSGVRPSRSDDDGALLSLIMDCRPRDEESASSGSSAVVTNVAEASSSILGDDVDFPNP